VTVMDYNARVARNIHVFTRVDDVVDASSITATVRLLHGFVLETGVVGGGLALFLIQRLGHPHLAEQPKRRTVLQPSSVHVFIQHHGISRHGTGRSH
jgi:hypothetical protein